MNVLRLVLPGSLPATAERIFSEILYPDDMLKKIRFSDMFKYAAYLTKTNRHSLLGWILQTYRFEDRHILLLSTHVQDNLEAASVLWEHFHMKDSYNSVFMLYFLIAATKHEVFGIYLMDQIQKLRSRGMCSAYNSDLKINDVVTFYARYAPFTVPKNLDEALDLVTNDISPAFVERLREFHRIYHF